MHHRKIIDVLKKLTGQQMERLNDFLHSPYFNKDEDVVLLFRYFHSLYPLFPLKELRTEQILKKITTLADENALSKKATALFDLLTTFLAYEFNSAPAVDNINALRAFKQLDLPKHFLSVSARLRKELQRSAFHDFDYLWQVHRLEEEMFEGFEQSLLRNPDNSLDKVLQSLDEFYNAKKLRYMIEAIYREQLLGKTIREKDKTEVEEYINAPDSENNLYRHLYGNIYKMNVERSPEKAMIYYHEVKATIQAFFKDIPKDEIRSICVYLQNHCIRYINKQDQEFIYEFLEIIKFRIEKGLLLKNNRLNPQLFKNIISAAVRLNEFSWAEEFVKKFSKKLPVEYRNDYAHLAQAELLYGMKNFAHAAQHLIRATHNKKDVYFSFHVKKLLLKIGYESDDLALDAYVEMYRKHLERYKNKIGENALLLEKFLKYFRLLLRGDSEKTMEIFIKKLSEEDNFPEKNWLLQMAQKKLLPKLATA